MCDGSWIAPVADRGPQRVAFTHISRRLWAGGYNYQRNLFAALNRHCPGQVAPVVFAGEQDDAEEMAALSSVPGVEVVRSSAFDRSSLGIAVTLATGLDSAAAAAFADHRIDAVFESARFFGWRLSVPALAWIPDLQHRRLPHMFSPAARWRRELGFRVQIASRRHIVLSSESAARDCRAYYPDLADRVSVVRFASQPEPALLTADPGAIVTRYGLPPSYVYLPNQFYRHKNHQVVVNALTILQARGVDVVVAASGSKDDPREPGLFDALMEEVRQRGLAENFCYLGMIPLDHVYALLRAANGLINPSRFEGWSTTVEEAKSFGVPMILSDIAVHREQAGAVARYFEVDDAEALAGYLAAVAQSPEPSTVRNLLPGLDKRVAAFAGDFVAAVEKCVHQFVRRS
jgi:glycosyltransferase involved in cell wall biosynthesis